MLMEYDKKGFYKIYNIMKKSFPKSEVRSYFGQKALLKDNRYKILIKKKDKKIIGVICVWTFENLSFIEHFAIDKKYRNCGYGSEMLKEISSMVSGYICLEVEPPVSSLQQRRVDFYIRNGFFINDYDYCQPAFSEKYGKVPLKIMTYGKSISKAEFDFIKGIIYKEVYHQKDENNL